MSETLRELVEARLGERFDILIFRSVFGDFARFLPPGKNALEEASARSRVDPGIAAFNGDRMFAIQRVGESVCYYLGPAWGHLYRKAPNAVATAPTIDEALRIVVPFLEGAKPDGGEFLA